MLRGKVFVLKQHGDKIGFNAHGEKVAYFL